MSKNHFWHFPRIICQWVRLEGNTLTEHERLNPMQYPPRLHWSLLPLYFISISDGLSFYNLWQKGWLLRPETLQIFDQSDVRRTRLKIALCKTVQSTKPCKVQNFCKLHNFAHSIAETQTIVISDEDEKRAIWQYGKQHK